MQSQLQVTTLLKDISNYQYTNMCVFFNNTYTVSYLRTYENVIEDRETISLKLVKRVLSSREVL